MNDRSGNVKPEKTEKQNGPPPNAPAVEYNSNTGILLRYDAKAKDWVVMPHRALVHPGERIAAPAPFEAVLDVDEGLCRVNLLPETSVRLLEPREGLPFGFEIDRGRIILQGRRPRDDGDGAGPGVVLGIAVGDELWRVELTPAETRCGIEIIPPQPNQLEQELGKNAYTGGLYVASGSVRFTDGSGRVRVVELPSPISLAPKDRAAAANPEIPAQSPLPPVLPVWVDKSEKRTSSTFRRYANLFEKEFEVDQPTSFIVPAMVKDPRPQISEMATKCLALTGNYTSLVQALAQPEHEEARLAAIDGLRIWLPQSPENGKLLKDELQKTFHTDDAEAVYRLLWGYNEKDARNRFTSNQLVEWLDHDEIAVRELAFYYIYLLTGRRYDYLPLLPAAQRKAAVTRWRAHLEKAGALLSE